MVSGQQPPRPGRAAQAAALLSGDRGHEATRHHRLQILLPGRAHQGYRRAPVRHRPGLRVQAGGQDRAADH